MPSSSWQTWNSNPFSVDRKTGTAPGTVILCFHGPFTMRDAYSNASPTSLSKMFELECAEGEAPCTKNILDLTACPFVDSSGLGLIVSHMVHCQKKGVKVIVAGLTPRVREVFKLTKMDSVIPLVASVEEAEAR